jgi:hypothetical protein
MTEAETLTSVVQVHRSGLPAMACVSAMQKAISRGTEKEAMEFAVELMHTSKAFHSMVCNRLEVICHEVLDTIAAPHVVPFVATAVAQSRSRKSATRRRSVPTRTKPIGCGRSSSSGASNSRIARRSCIGG